MPKYLLQDVKYYGVMVPIFLKLVRYDGIAVMTDDPSQAMRFANPDAAEEYRLKHLRALWFRTYSIDYHATHN